ncbi:winged helix-turn-helix transcriptional regulator [Candidatus Roizmanbacteria bacterium]|nr:winged helix-turn-helix transcriptional regulator [Candidatus Roizmanbacteria bacterium]
MKYKANKFRKLERLVRGFSNHRRIQIMDLLDKNPELSVAEIAESLRVNFKTISEHTRKLAITGLVLKRNSGNSVRHKLSPRGQSILEFLRIQE